MSSETKRQIKSKHLWKVSCSFLSLFYLISFLTFGYLKYTGEIMPFCLYDNLLFGVYYFGAFLYSFFCIELIDVPVSCCNNLYIF